MKEKNIKQEKGVTLIALVITILVLLILAGVAISMLSGENGILNKAAEAKTKTESESFIEKVKIATMGAMTNEDAEIQEAELITELEKAGIKKDTIISYGNGEYLVIKDTEKVIISNNGKVEYNDEIKEIDIELQKYFNEQNLNYKCKYGYVTGFERQGNHTVEYVENVESKLPNGYEIISKYNSTEEQDGDIDNKSTTYISTGMVIAKNGQEVARTVIFGDVNCDKMGIINTADASCLIDSYNNFKDMKDFQKIAANVNNDKELTDIDAEIIIEKTKIDQQMNISTSAKNIRRKYTELQQYISLLDVKAGYSFEYNEETDTYKLKGVKKNTTVENLINSLPEKDKIKVFSKTGDNEVNGESVIGDGYYLEVNGCKFAYIEIEK